MRRLAAACGIRESSIYNHFPNKRALFAAVLEPVGPGAVPRLAGEIGAAEPPPPFPEALRTLTRRLLAAWTDPLHQQLYLLSLREPEAAREATGRTRAATVDEAVAALAGLLERYAARGEIALAEDAQFLAWLFLAPLANLRLTFLAPDAAVAERERAGRLVEQHLTRFIASIAAEGQSP